MARESVPWEDGASPAERGVPPVEPGATRQRPVPDALTALRQLQALAAELGAEGVAAEAAALGERVAEGRFFVACVGQFKRGKSTLINALVGDAVLPTGVVPVTAVVTVVRYGTRRTARVRLAGRPWQEVDPATLAAYVAESENPQNRKGVKGVEVLVPSARLASGMCLVDTPGVGSVFAASTEAVREFVPHVDAALVVLGADPPLAADELALVEAVARHTDRLLFVLNKADRLSPAERAEARRFAAGILGERLRRPVEPIREVSSVEALAGRRTDGWRALEAELDRLAAASGADLVRAAAARGLVRLADRLLAIIDARRDALRRPVEESEGRLAALHQAVEDAERVLRDLGPLFAAEQARVVGLLRDELETFLARVRPDAAGRLEAALATAGGLPARALRREALEAARRIAHDLVHGWLRDAEPRAEALYREAAGRFVALAADFLARLHRSGEPAFRHLPAAAAPEPRLRGRPRFHFTELLASVGPHPAAWLMGRLGLRRLARQLARREAADYLDRLLVANTARVANDLIDRVVESRRAVEAELASLLREVTGSAEQALAEARARHAAGAEAVREGLGRLDALRRQVQALRDAAGP